MNIRGDDQHKSVSYFRVNMKIKSSHHVNNGSSCKQENCGNNQNIFRFVCSFLYRNGRHFSKLENVQPTNGLFAFLFLSCN